MSSDSTIDDVDSQKSDDEGLDVSAIIIIVVVLVVCGGVAGGASVGIWMYKKRQKSRCLAIYVANYIYVHSN